MSRAKLHCISVAMAAFGRAIDRASELATSAVKVYTHFNHTTKSSGFIGRSRHLLALFNNGDPHSFVFKFGYFFFGFFLCFFFWLWIWESFFVCYATLTVYVYLIFYSIFLSFIFFLSPLSFPACALKLCTFMLAFGSFGNGCTVKCAGKKPKCRI